MTAPSPEIKAGAIPLRDAYRRLGGTGDPRHAYVMVRERRWPTPTIRLGSRILVPIKALEEYLNGTHDGAAQSTSQAD
jgi:hypothetical protein